MCWQTWLGLGAALLIIVYAAWRVALRWIDLSLFEKDDHP
jgi:hypothetical protein